ncbi:MAG: hypothetical protein GWO38_26875, partial [Phycisphaerae bacterium]|nr:hypothetical protein [Phycisphaerae bacterium]NIX00928.1 hypothetical protein [Phycisphaerae bacterium]NIX31153.1 hypothetical protein [Phycisphaerae bacterium]
MVQLHSAIVFVALVYSSWAMGASEERCIYYYTGCESAEVYSDIEVSISGITRFAEENDIRLVAEDKSKKCGYLLVFGDKTRYIRSAMTDVDLLLLSKEFFG